MELKNHFITMNEELEEVFRRKDITPTAMRIRILQYLQQQIVAVSLQDLEANFQHSDRITLYRTLKTFEEKGLIHGIIDGTDATKYALCADACKAGAHFDLHLHFYCYSCKGTYCLPKHKVPELTLPENFIMEELNLVAKGICNICSDKQCN